MITIKENTWKILILTFLSITVTGPVTAGSFNSLPDANIADGDVTIAANNFAFNPDYVELEYRGPGGNSGAVNMSDQGNGNWTVTFDKDDDASGTQGDYVFEAIAYNQSGDTDSTSDQTITLDASKPDVTFSGTEYVGEGATVSFKVSDDYTEVQDVSAKADDPQILNESTDPNCNPGKECTVDFDLNTGNLNDGDKFSISVNASDAVNNLNTGNTFEFTFDDSFEGDSDPKLTVENSVKEGIVRMENSDSDVNVDIDLSEEDEPSDVQAICYVNGEKIKTTGFKDPDDVETEFSCEIDGGDHSGSKVNFEVEICDEAGNCADPKSMKIYLDASSPSIQELKNPVGVSSFNNQFELKTVATDDASGIGYMEYYFDSDTSKGSGFEVSIGSIDTDLEKTFSVDPSRGSLNQGEHTVYVRLRDEANRWSEAKEFNFQYYPDRSPEISISTQSQVEITSGTTKTIDVTIQNKAPFLLGKVTVKSDSGLWNGSITGEKMEKNEQKQKTIELDASGFDIGVYNMTLGAEGFDSSRDIKVIVRANSEQQSELSKELEKWKSKRDSLIKNISKINTLEKTNENVSGFISTVKRAESAADSGNYYKVKNILQDVDSKYSTASQTYSAKLKEYRINQRNKLIIGALVFTLMLSGGGIAGYLIYFDEEERAEILEEIELPEEIPEIGLKEKINDKLEDLGLKEKIDNLIEDVEEKEEEYSFQGFN